MGVVTAAVFIILLITLFLILKKKPDFLYSIVGKSKLDERELEPVDSKHTQGQDEGNYDQRAEDYYDKNNYDQRGEEYYNQEEEYNYY